MPVAKIPVQILMDWSGGEEGCDIDHEYGFANGDGLIGAPLEGLKINGHRPFQGKNGTNLILNVGLPGRTQNLKNLDRVGGE